MKDQQEKILCLDNFWKKKNIVLEVKIKQIISKLVIEVCKLKIKESKAFLNSKKAGINVVIQNPVSKQIESLIDEYLFNYKVLNQDELKDWLKIKRQELIKKNGNFTNTLYFQALLTIKNLLNIDNKDAIKPNEIIRNFLEISILPKQRRGYRLEAFFTQLMKYNNIEVWKPFKVTGEQIDGAIKHEGHYYLVELKWTNNKIQAKDIYILKGKVDGKLDTRGVFISMSGYTDETIKCLTIGKELKVILLDGTHLINTILGKYTFKALLNYSLLEASTKGNIYSPDSLQLPIMS